MMWQLVLLVSTASWSLGHGKIAAPEGSNSTTDPSPEYRLLYRIYEDCTQKSTVECLKLKAIVFLDRAIRRNDIQVSENVFFVRKQDSLVEEQPDHKPLTEFDVEASLPRTLYAREVELDNMLLDKMTEFIRTHSLEFKLPGQISEEPVQSHGTGRRILRKLLLPFLIGVVLKAGTFIPIILGGMSLLAINSFFMSKASLLLSAIVGIRKLLAGQGAASLLGGAGGPPPSAMGYGGVYGSGYGGGYGYGRAFEDNNTESKKGDTEEEYHQLAYQGQKVSFKEEPK